MATGVFKAMVEATAEATAEAPAKAMLEAMREATVTEAAPAKMVHQKCKAR